MKRKIRILRIWYFGRIELAKKMKIRSMYEGFHRIAIRNSIIYKYLTLDEYINLVNVAKIHFFSSTIKTNQ